MRLRFNRCPRGRGSRSCPFTSRPSRMPACSGIVGKGAGCLFAGALDDRDPQGMDGRRSQTQPRSHGQRLVVPTDVFADIHQIRIDSAGTPESARARGDVHGHIHRTGAPRSTRPHDPTAGRRVRGRVLARNDRALCRGIRRVAVAWRGRPQFIPILVEGLARERLRALAQPRGGSRADDPEVLFVCVQNAGRSQIAAALLESSCPRPRARPIRRKRAGGRLHPAVVTAIPSLAWICRTSSRSPTEEVVQAADVVVTMGCGDACPLLPGKQYLDWMVPDPPDNRRSGSGRSATRSSVACVSS